jgi:hypothetical protein
MPLTTIRGGRQILNTTIPYEDLQNVTANTVLANNTASATFIQEVALSSNTLLGRGSTGNIAAITLGTGLSFSGTVLNASGAIGGSTGSVDNAVLRADGTGGVTVQTSDVFINDFAWINLGSNSLSGSERNIQAVGSASNIDIVLQPKGTGASKLYSSDLNSYFAASTFSVVGYANNASGSNVTFQALNSTTTALTDIAFNSGEQLLLRRKVTATNTVQAVLRLQAQSTGTAAAGFGTSIEYLLPVAAGSDSILASETIDIQTFGSNGLVDYYLKLQDTSGANVEKFRVKGTGQIKFNGYTTSTSFTGTAAGYLAFDSSGNLLSVAVPSGTIGGSTGSVDNAILRADGTGGSTLQSSSIILDDSANLTLGTTSLAGADRTITVAGSSNSIDLILTPKSTDAGSQGSVYVKKESGTSFNTGINDGIVLQISSSQAPGVGFGVGVKFQAEDSLSTIRNIGLIAAVYSDLTPGGLDSDLTFFSNTNSTSPSEKMRILSTGQLKLNNYTSSSSFTGTAAGYLAFDSSGNILTVAVPSVSDGDKGDITVSGSGATWTIDNTAVTYAKIQNVAADSFLANATGSAATIQEIATTRIPLFSSAITGTPSASTYLRGDGSWSAVSGGITTLNTLTATTQTFATGTTGTDFNISSATSTHTFNIPDAGASARGLVTTGTQTLAGQKTFSSAINLTSGQIIFPATQNGSADANTLDDYEEGTFTPSFSAISSTFSYASRQGYYTKIGNSVTCIVYIRLNTSGNTLAANALTITSLPFPARNATDYQIVSDGRWANISTALIRFIAELTSTNSSLTLRKVTATTTSVTTSVVASDLNATGGSFVAFSFVYQI